MKTTLIYQFDFFQTPAYCFAKKTVDRIVMSDTFTFEASICAGTSLLLSSLFSFCGNELSLI
jgi:hypothetical protein